MNPDMSKAGKEPAGAMVSIVIIALIIIAGAYYTLRKIPAPEVTPNTVGQVDPMTAAFSQQGTSDVVADIQKDLNATPNTSTIGAGLGSLPL